MFDADAPTTLNVVENTAAEVNIGGPITATDPEEDTLTYSLDTNDGAAFEIDANGQITTKEAIDRETKDSYSVTVSVHDGKDASGSSDTTVDATRRVTITVGDANDKPAFASNAVTTLEVAENTPAGRSIGAAFTATDPDRDGLTYSLDDNDGASFTIDQNGQIKTKDPLDYEGGQNTYIVTVSVHDGKDDQGNTETTPTPDDTIDVTIDVNDVNEKPAFASDAPGTLSVDENTATDQPIGDAFTATDPDAADDALTYSLGGTDAAHFDIGTSGQVKTKGALNREDKEVYSVIVQVSDARNDAGAEEDPPVVDTTHAVTITVADADDTGILTLSTEHPGVDAPVTATLTDEDGGVTNEVWAWESSADGSTGWTAIPGTDTSSYTPVQGDIGKYLRVTVTYDDTHGSGKTLTEQADNRLGKRRPELSTRILPPAPWPRTRRRAGTSGRR